MTPGHPSSPEQRRWQALWAPSGTFLRPPLLALLWGARGRPERVIYQVLRPRLGVSQAEGSSGARALPLLHLLVPGGSLGRDVSPPAPQSGDTGFPCNLGGQRRLEEAARAVKVVSRLPDHSLLSLLR